MQHTMGLYEAPFHSIKSGKKTIEVRLYDEKRRKLNIGDCINFIKVPESKEVLVAEIVDLEIFPTFKKMYETIPSSKLDAEEDSIDTMLEQTYKIYTPEQEKRWGTLAITIKFIELTNPE